MLYVRGRPVVDGSVRSRSTGLEKVKQSGSIKGGSGTTGAGAGTGTGTGNAAETSPPASVDHKALFRPNLIIEFGEDSPQFRRKVEALDRNVEGNLVGFILLLRAI